MNDCHARSGFVIADPPPSLLNNGGDKTGRPHVVAIIGPPNSGKSTLFNRLTGLRQKVANFPGVTVEQRVGKAKMPGAGHHRDVVLVDLPGVYSLTPRSEDEQVTRDVLSGAMPGIPKPDALLLILDCTNLGRHLVLAAPILALKLPTLVILNMADDLAGRGGKVDIAELASELGAPVALISASKASTRCSSSWPEPPPEPRRSHRRASSCPSCRMSRSAANGRTKWDRAQVTAPPPHPSGPVVSTPSSCTRSLDH